MESDQTQVGPSIDTINVVWGFKRIASITHALRQDSDVSIPLCKNHHPSLRDAADVLAGREGKGPTAYSDELGTTIHSFRNGQITNIMPSLSTPQHAMQHQQKSTLEHAEVEGWDLPFLLTEYYAGLASYTNYRGSASDFCEETEIDPAQGLRYIGVRLPKSHNLSRDHVSAVIVAVMAAFALGREVGGRIIPHLAMWVKDEFVELCDDGKTKAIDPGTTVAILSVPPPSSRATIADINMILASPLIKKDNSTRHISFVRIQRPHPSSVSQNK
jgi:hypothetical protein